MSSWVLFKFKSSKEPIRITFDGTGITVFELKREIINVSQLGDGTDFDLQIYDESTNDEYDDDTVIVPRASMVVARRMPAARPGHGKAARYVSGRMPATYRRSDQKQTSSAPGTDALAAMNNAKTEQERIEAMFAAEGDQWQKQQQEMSHAKPIFFKTGQQKRPAFADKPLPPGYICHRCQQKGHWIYDCPTNDDPNFVPKPKLKKTTGIPRSFLEKIDKSEIIEEEDDGKAPKGYMIDADGNRVRVKTDTATWEKEQARQKATAAKKEAAEEENKELKDRGLECDIDNRLFEVPTKTPCCSKTYCHTCIEDALVNNDLVCPNCGQENVLIDDLLPDTEMGLKIKAYRDEKDAEAKAKEAADKAEAEKAEAEAQKAKAAAEAAAAQEAAESVEATAADEKDAKDTKSENNALETNADTKQNDTEGTKRSVSPAGSNTSASGQNARASSTESSAKKRRAEEELEDDRASKAPKAPTSTEKEQDKNQSNQNGFNPQFLADMEKLSSGNFQGQQGMPNMPMMPNNMGMPMGMNPMMNPIMNPMAMMGMPGLGMPNMMNGMGMPMGMPNMMGGGNMGFNNGFNNNNNFNNNQQQQQQQNWQNQQRNWNNNSNNNFNGPNRGGYQNGMGRGNFNAGHNNNNINFRHNPNFNRHHPNEEDSPYLRQPVNPHRQKQKRMRPSEYTELGH